MKYILAAVLVFFAAFLSAHVSATASGIKFSYDAPDAGEVSVAGSFNSWNTDANKLSKDANGVWQTSMVIEAGKHTYKFVIDGNWVHDAENHMIEDDGYGGTNSLFEVDSTGKLIVSKADVGAGIKAIHNPKLTYTGRYYTLNNFVHGDKQKRHMLDKPYHDLKLGMRVKFNTNFQAYVEMNINNSEEGSEMSRTHLTFKRNYLKLKNNILSLTAFDNMATIVFDNPGKLVGDEGRYHYAFGHHQRGLYVMTNKDLLSQFHELPITAQVSLLYADKTGDNDADTGAARLVTSYPFQLLNSRFDANFGGGVFAYRNTGSNNLCQPDLNNSENVEHLHDAYELDFVLNQNVDNATNPVNSTTQYEYYTFTNKYRYLSEEEHIKQAEYKWQSGYSHYFYSSEKRKKLSRYLSYKYTDIDYYQELASTSSHVPSPYISKESIKKQEYKYGVAYSMDNGISFTFDTHGWKYKFPGRYVSWNNYITFFERTDGNGRWFQEFSDLSFHKYTLLGYKKGLLLDAKLAWDGQLIGHRVETSMASTIAQSGYFKEAKYAQNIIDMRLHITGQWSVYSNTRIPYYNDDVLGINTNFAKKRDLFISNYSELRFAMRNNITLKFSWGVSPDVIDDVSDDWLSKGRESYLEEQADFVDHVNNSYFGIGKKIRFAEEQLQKENRFSIEAEMKF